MESNIYVNFEKRENTTELQTPNHKQDEGKAQKSRGSECLVLMTVCLGLICVLLMVDASIGILQFIMSRDLVKSYKNSAEELNQTINSLMTEQDQLNNFSSLTQKKLELEARVNDLTAEKIQLQNNLSSLSQKKLELESKVTSLSGELQKAYEKGYQVGWGSGWFFISSESKSWTESRQFCRDRGADLIIINTEEKQKFISSFVNAKVWPEGVWIGLTDIDQEGILKWVNNSPLKLGFWYTGEPKKQFGTKDCVELMSSFPMLNWRVIPCSNGRKVICEK